MGGPSYVAARPECEEEAQEKGWTNTTCASQISFGSKQKERRKEEKKTNIWPMILYYYFYIHIWHVQNAVWEWGRA